MVIRELLADNHTQGISTQSLEPQILFADDGYFAFILDPPPALMLGACLVLGCAISSFAYRRQVDKQQTPIFICAIIMTITIGLALGVNTNLIMLAMIPWALVLAMILSAGVHWLSRRYRRSRITAYCEIRCCELGEKEAVASSSENLEKITVES